MIGDQVAQHLILCLWNLSSGFLHNATAIRSLVIIRGEASYCTRATLKLGLTALSTVAWCGPFRMICDGEMYRIAAQRNGNGTL